MNRRELGVLGLGAALLLGLSGCDWGNNNRLYHNSFEQTDAAVKKLFPEAPRKEAKKGMVVYGEEKPVEEAHFPETNLVVKVKPEKNGQTQVKVKARENHDMVIKQRERDAEVEKAVLDKIGNELAAAKPAETKPTPAPAQKTEAPPAEKK